MRQPSKTSFRQHCRRENDGITSRPTYRYGEGVKTHGWPRYQGRLWQRNYYERVVRDERELARFRAYIDANPARWFEDPYRD